MMLKIYNLFKLYGIGKVTFLPIGKRDTPKRRNYGKVKAAPSSYLMEQTLVTKTGRLKPKTAFLNPQR